MIHDEPAVPVGSSPLESALLAVLETGFHSLYSLSALVEVIT
jgi:hypothetical protein